MVLRSSRCPFFWQRHCVFRPRGRVGRACVIGVAGPPQIGHRHFSLLTPRSDSPAVASVPPTATVLRRLWPFFCAITGLSHWRQNMPPLTLTPISSASSFFTDFLDLIFAFTFGPFALFGARMADARRPFFLFPHESLMPFVFFERFHFVLCLFQFCFFPFFGVLLFVQGFLGATNIVFTARCWLFMEHDAVPYVFFAFARRVAANDARLQVGGVFTFDGFAVQSGTVRSRLRGLDMRGCGRGSAPAGGRATSSGNTHRQAGEDSENCVAY